MQDHEPVPDEGNLTEERLNGCRAEVWWDEAAAVTFPTSEARRSVLAPLEAAMRRYDTTTFYYHAEEIDGWYVTYRTAEEDGCIYVAVSIGAPLAIGGFDLDAFLPAGNDDAAVERTLH